MLLDLLLEKKCISCQKKGSFLCKTCQNNVDIYFFDKKNEDLYILFFLRYTIKNLLFSLKYKKNIQSAKFLSFLAKKNFRQLLNELNKKVDLVIPIPTTFEKKFIRGFNPIYEISKHLFPNKKILTNVLKIRQNNKNFLHFLNKQQREIFIKNNLFINKKQIQNIKNKKILIIDDIYTTGATVKTAKKLLKKHGAKKILILCISKS